MSDSDAEMEAFFKRRVPGPACGILNRSDAAMVFHAAGYDPCDPVESDLLRFTLAGTDEVELNPITETLSKMAMLKVKLA